MTSDQSNYHRGYSPDGLYSLFQFEGSDVISVLKKLNRDCIECLLVQIAITFETLLFTDPCQSTLSVPRGQCSVLNANLSAISIHSSMIN